MAAAAYKKSIDIAERWGLFLLFCFYLFFLFQETPAPWLVN